ncbi:uncharacterized protein LOC121737779 [Aricia agestis]|uniref:uncharacterized protein LOC121737779 n=1 Tax=Aricia agestis TaxID=91739 RepID=UPI001C208C12|nr:uncharacterized protein LOC121737779 [Aricia agestis]
MSVLDRIPTVISCCFCCFLRAGTIMIAIFTFALGAFYVPNLAYLTDQNYLWHTAGESVLSYLGTATEHAARCILGCAGLMLMIIGIMLIVGALCNFAKLLSIYEWGLIIHTAITTVLYFALAMVCFFYHSQSYQTGIILLGIVVLNLVVTAYFVIVVNSLRMSISYLKGYQV